MGRSLARLYTGLPVLVAIDCVLLIFAHLEKGASIQVDGVAPLGLLQPHSAADDNLISAVNRLAKAQGWLFVLIVAGFSGFWPYAKLFGTWLAVVLVRREKISRKQALVALHTLEFAGKFSFADVFLIVFNFLIFHISTAHFRVVTMPLYVDLWMQMKIGTVFLLIAITLSALITHWALSELAQAEAITEEAKEKEPSEEAPLLQADASEADLTTVPAWKHLCAVLLPVLAIVVFIVGASLPVITVDRGGFFGNLIEEQHRQIKVGTFSMVGALLEPMQTGENVKAVFTIFYVTYALLAPLAELLCLAMSSLARAGRWPRAWGEKALFYAEWAYSLDASEVLIVTAAILLVDLKVVVDFEIDTECQRFGTMMHSKPLLNLAGLGFAYSKTCFETKPHLAVGWYLLVAVVILRTFSWQASRMVREGGKKRLVV